MTLRRATVSVPGSTSNLGGGFDCVGMAVDRWVTASVEIDAHSPGVRIARSGTLAALTCNPLDDLLYCGFAEACRQAHQETPPDLSFTVTSTIPVARGLGSSAAALVAGAGLADAALGLGLGVRGIALLVSRLEGHPDNAAPSTFGSAMLGVARNAIHGDSDDRYVFSPLAVHPSLAFVFAVPELEVTTAAARAVLPATVPFAQAVQAVQRSAALVHGLATGEAELLTMALSDVLHVPYRRALVPGYDAVVAAACRSGAFGGTLSGSGSALLAVGPKNLAPAMASAMVAAFAANGLDASSFLSEGAVGGMRAGRQGVSSETSAAPAP